MKEYEFHSKLDIKYLFEKCETSTNLIIVFSGYSSDPVLKAKYNYIKVLRSIKCNKLFILDNYGYDERGCWYLGENLDFQMEYSVIELIKSIQGECCIDNEDVILCGTSKGGFASIYFGVKYGYGHIVAGAPQIKLYDYIKKFPNILNNMIGNTANENVERLNNIILDLDVKPINNFYLVCGTKDMHLNKHVIPFIKKLDLNVTNVYLNLIEGNHNSIGEYFATNLGNFVIDIINRDMVYTTIGNIEEVIKNYF